MDWQAIRDVSWWHWALTVGLLAAHLDGYSWALVGAMVLCAAVGAWFLSQIGRFRPYPVQVRIAYLGLLAIGTLPGMGWMHWVQLAGTTAMVTVGYCPLIRLLSLLPLNRAEPLTAGLVLRAIAKDPCAGGLVKWSAETPGYAMRSCSLSVDRATTARLSLSPLAAQERPSAPAH